MKKTVATINFNTPELVEAAFLSIRKHGGEDYNFVVFDNSDKRPFKKRMKGVRRIDNTKGQIIDLEKELEKFPDKNPDIGCAKGCNYGSDKHIMTVQKMWDLIPEGFILIDSDILVKQSIDFMFMEDECACGHISRCTGPLGIQRFSPLLLWINVPMCKAGGARFYDPDRSWALHRGTRDRRNFWDTGAAFLDDIKRLKPQCHGQRIDIRPLMEHYGSGSWLKNDLEEQMKWLEKHAELWK